MKSHVDWPEEKAGWPVYVDLGNSVSPEIPSANLARHLFGNIQVNLHGKPLPPLSPKLLLFDLPGFERAWAFGLCRIICLKAVWRLFCAIWSRILKNLFGSTPLSLCNPPRRVVRHMHPSGFLGPTPRERSRSGFAALRGRGTTPSVNGAHPLRQQNLNRFPSKWFRRKLLQDHRLYGATLFQWTERSVPIFEKTHKSTGPRPWSQVPDKFYPPPIQ